MIFKIKTDKPIIFLTIDDGPCDISTPNTLNILDKYGIKATFFCIGEKILKNKELSLKIKTEGHYIANHSFLHINGWKTKLNDYLLNVKLGENITNSKIFRPPYGKLSPLQYLHLKKTNKIVLWSLMVYDFDNSRNIEKEKKLIENKLKPGAIIVFHDNENAVRKKDLLLPYLIELALEKNYTFHTLDQLNNFLTI